MTTERAQCATALLLAPAAGAVDAVSFVLLHQTFTANMTGNSTSLGIAAGRTDAAALVPLAAAVGAFFGAIVLGTAGIGLVARRGVRATAAPALLVEAALLAVFMAAGAHIVRNGTAPDHAIDGFYLLLTVAVVAMGIQTATFTKALRTTIRTTFISGLITTVCQELVNVLAPESGGSPSYLRDELGLGSRGQSLGRLASISRSSSASSSARCGAGTAWTIGRRGCWRCRSALSSVR